MIYLIDDNRREQQKEYGCNYIGEGKYSDVLIVWYRLSNMDDLLILNSATCILLHDSFPDFDVNGKVLQGSTKIIEEIRDIARENNIPLVIFSNSFNGFEQARFAPNHITGLNKRLFYKNLEDLLSYLKAHAQLELKILAFGKNFKFRELESLYFEISTYISVYGIDATRRNASGLIDSFGKISGSQENVNKDFLELDERGFLNSIDRLIKFYIRYGRSIYS